MSTTSETMGPGNLQERALAHLGFIRETMAASRTFTAVSGIGTMAVGAIGIAAAIVCALPALQQSWLPVWLGAAVVAVSVGGGAMWHKARRLGTALHHGLGLRFILSLLPAIIAAAVLTIALAGAGSSELVPGVWLLLYGVAITAGGAFSVRLIPLVGGLFASLGAIALFVPTWGNILLGLGFGGLNLMLGYVIARRYGG